ncbi:class I SAM-dependent methyltransferase, partial [Phenylobacterium sp.]|uniref:class I SAM-dependent methyltransferase n=1 Tax=Phenylobacterium sp. TaxID=1871053 RepID=UPI00286C5650
MTSSAPGDQSRPALGAAIVCYFIWGIVPLVFQAYAEDLVARVVSIAGMESGALLEVAAGTGVVTRLLAAALPPEVVITATDLVPGMLERAARVGTARPVTWE